MDKNHMRQQLTDAVKAYGKLASEAATKGKSMPRALGTGITRTEVLTVIDAMLTELDLDVFEIQIWRSMRWSDTPEDNQ